MKLKPTVLLATFVVTMGLLLGTSAAQATEVILDGDNVIQILDLPVTDENTGKTRIYNVDFVYDTAINVYGSGLDSDFPPPGGDETIILALAAVNNALNFNVPIPPAAGPLGDKQFFIGYKEEDGLFVAIGGENFAGVWEPCATGCINVGEIKTGVTLLQPSETVTYADFTAATGGDPVTIGGSVTGLEGSGLVLQNNGSDDLTITGNGAFTFDAPLTPGNSYNVTVATNPTNPAQTCSVINGSGQVPTEDVTDVTVSCGEAADPVTIGGSVTGLEGSGLVLQNNGSDNLPIDGDGPFTFATSLTPGITYDVTVATNPTNPAQICSVINGKGQVPTEDVTDVTVSCGEALVGDVIKVAAEGDTLPDDTVLTDILLDGGVALNEAGKVAFGGKDDDGTDAAFTQDGKVVAEGETLDDGTLLAKFRGLGEVAINAGQSGDQVAFHAEAEDGFNDIDAVFTQAGMVAAVGDTLPEGTLDQIDDEGKVAINLFDQVAFHGKIEIEGGLFDEKFRAVFTSDGQTTQVAAREASILPDGKTVETIDQTGGVAINDFDEVAFHGDVVDPAHGSDTLKAVFTTDGLVAAEGDKLLDDTLLDDIDENGGVAINLFGDVAFHGDAVVPDTGGDTVRAVFTQDGLVVKEGDILPDGTPLDEIEVSGGVAINLFGDVAFHGRTGGVKAVFTQHGLVAKEGENLTDGTTLNEINDSAGVAINTYGFEVAFHGVVDRNNAVFVGQIPVVVGDEPSGE